MKVRIIARDGYGDRHGNQHECGDVVDFPDVIGAKVVKYGYGVEVAAPVIETAAVTPARNAAKRTTKPKPRRKSQ